MATTIKLAYEDTFDVFVKEEQIGAVSLMSTGWAAYRIGSERRIGTYPNAEAAIRALDAK